MTTNIVALIIVTTNWVVSTEDNGRMMRPLTSSGIVTTPAVYFYSPQSIPSDAVKCDVTEMTVTSNKVEKTEVMLADKCLESKEKLLESYSHKLVREWRQVATVTNDVKRFFKKKSLVPGFGILLKEDENSITITCTNTPIAVTNNLHNMTVTNYADPHQIVTNCNITIGTNDLVYRFEVDFNPRVGTTNKVEQSK